MMNDAEFMLAATIVTFCILCMVTIIVESEYLHPIVRFVCRIATVVAFTINGALMTLSAYPIVTKALAGLLA